ncbi:MAG: sigma-70 family RNA polymerase sigma factor [Nocardioidaceae bacterium]
MVTGSSGAPDATELLTVAQQGDSEAFGRLVEPHRAELQAHCYRMLGSFHDAEDALQETLLRAWRALPRFGRQRQFRAWLYKIATNACLDTLKRRSRRLLPVDHGPALAPDGDPGEPVGNPIWVEPYPDRESGGPSDPEAAYVQRESVELAFITALQHLPPSQRAALMLRDVLGFSARETAATLETTEAAVNSALQRARRSAQERLPGRSQQATLRALGDDRVRDIVQRYMNAWEQGDVAAIASMLAADATFAMPPYAAWWQGRDVIAAFASEPVHRYLPARANGQLANASYRWDPDKRVYVAEALEVLTLDGPLITQLTAFMMPELFPHFGLPDSLPR